VSRILPARYCYAVATHVVLLAVIAALLPALLIPAPAAAQAALPAGSFSVAPTPDLDIETPKNAARDRVPASRSWFTFRGEPGQVIRDSLRVVNTGQTPLDLLVYPVDATTGATTGMVMLNRDAPRKGVSAWVQISQVAQPTVHLESGKTIDVEFVVSVPAALAGGEYWGGLMVEDTFVRRGSGQFAVDQVFRSGVALGVTLPGPRVEKLSVRGISAKVVNDLNQVFVIDLANEGNVLLKSRGAFELKDASGRVVGRHELNLDNVLPGTSVPFELFWVKEGLPAGKYEASVTLSYSPSAAPVALTVRDLPVEAPGMRLAATAPAAQSGGAAVINVVPRSEPAGPLSPLSPLSSGPLQTVLSGIVGAAVMGGGLLVYRLVRRERRGSRVETG
jgi:hypothetical protein